MPEKIHIIRELNVIEPSDLVTPRTVWACIGNADDYTETGTKIAGPIPALFADRVIEGLEALLTRLGHNVIIETAADD